MKQKVSTVLCVVLLALQLNAMVTAEEERAGSDGSFAAMVSGGDVIVAEGSLESVSQGDVSGGDAASVSQGDVSGGDAASVSQGDVSEGDAASGEQEDKPGEDAASGGQEDKPEEDAVPGGQEEMSEEDDVSREQTDVSGGDAGSGEQGNVTDEELALEEAETIDLVNLAVVRLQVPKNLDFVIDPLGLCGRGTVWSQEYRFCNSGEKPIQLRFDNIVCFVREGVSCVDGQTDAQTVLDAPDKMIQLQLVLNDSDTVYITEQGTSHEMTVEAGQILAIRIAGAVSCPERELWQTGDVSLKVVYSAQVCADPEQEAGMTEEDVAEGEEE